MGYSFVRYLIHKKSELNRLGLLESRRVVSTWDTPIRSLLKDTRPKYYLIVLAFWTMPIVWPGCTPKPSSSDSFIEKGPQATLRQC